MLRERGQVFEQTGLVLVDGEHIHRDLVASILDLWPSTSEEFAQEGAALLITAYSVYRRLRGVAINSSDPDVQQQSIHDIKMIGEEVAGVLLSGDETEVNKLGLEVFNYDVKLCGKEQYTKNGGGNFSLIMRTLSIEVSARDYESLFRQLVHSNYYPGTELRIWNSYFKGEENKVIFAPYKDEVEKGRIRRVNFIGPVGSGWSYLTYSMVALGLDEDEIKRQLGVPGIISFTHNPVAFDMKGGKAVLPSDGIEKGDVLVLVDDCFSPYRYGQLREEVVKLGFSEEDVFIYGEPISE